MNTGKIERSAANAVEGYIDKCSNLAPIIFRNDKTPIWDGEIHIYKSEVHSVDNFSYRVPLQVKGTTNTKDDFYRIERKYLEGFKNDRGCIFFLVQEDENYNSSKILYAMLSSTELDALLKKDTKEVKIDLDVLPNDSRIFEMEIIEFAKIRNGEKIDNPATEEIKSLVEEFEKVREHLNEIEEDSARYDLESLLNSIKKLKDDGTVGWRDKFVYYSQKAIELAINNIKDYDFAQLQFGLGAYLHDQKLYHLVEDYYLKSLEAYREYAKDDPATYMGIVAMVLNALASLRDKLNRPIEAAEGFAEALVIYRDLAKDNPDAYKSYKVNTIINLATFLEKHNFHIEAERGFMEALKIISEQLDKDYSVEYLKAYFKTIHNLAGLHYRLNRPNEAEEEYKMALDFVLDLALDDPEYWDNVAVTLNNLAGLHVSLNRLQEAEMESKNAQEIRRLLAENNPAAYINDVATTLNTLGILHKNLNRPDEAEEEFKEALEIRRGLAKDNPAAYMGDVADTLNNLALLHDDLNRPDKAEKEYKEALEIYVGLAQENAIQYLEKMADTLNNLAGLYTKYNLFIMAEKVIRDAMKIYLKLSEDNLAYIGDVNNTLFNLAVLYANQKEFDKALESIDLIIGYKYGDVDCYDFKGVLLLMKGDEQGALAMWHKVMELDPDFLSKHNGDSKLHRLLKEKGLIDK